MIWLPPKERGKPRTT